jgi:hypothetical protein
MNDHRPIAPSVRPASVEGEVIESGARRVGDPSGEPGPGAAEPALRAMHGLLLGIVTLAVVVPTVVLVVAVIVPAVVLWLLAAALLRFVFRMLAAITGSRPAAVMPGAVLRARAVRGFTGFSRAWGNARES